jgi:5'-3' exonuclease
MKKKELLKLLDNVQEHREETVLEVNDRVLLIDGLNLFFRNFAMLNAVNPDGVHVGGLGGFFRSLGALIRQIQPTSVYVVFDGAGSTTNRKNLLPEYKSGRNLQRITNWEVFESLDDEDDAKIDQIVRVIQYLKTLPVKTISFDKVEADDIIAHLGHIIPSKPEHKVFIVSSDKDFIQLVNENVIVYRPIEKEFYTLDTVKEKFGLPASNFILYKTLLGDNSDKIRGVKGLGEKKLFKLFPELQTQQLTLDDIYNLSVERLKENVIYARIVNDINELEKNYKVMDLGDPMMGEKEKQILSQLVNTTELNYLPERFIAYYEADKLGGMIRNLDFWIKDIFAPLNSFNK